MTYEPQTWVDGEDGGTPVSGARLAHLEAGVAAAVAQDDNLADLASPAAARTNLGLAPVAASGVYTDLSGAPVIPVTYADLTGTVPQAALPALALTEYLGAVASQAAMLALTGQRGDWCTRTDLGTDWQLVADAPTLLVSWQEHLYPASPVQSVAGRTGAVVLTEADVSGLVGDLAGAAQKAANLSDLASAASARTSLGLATVAATGAYADLSGRPAIPAAYSDLTGTVPQGALPAVALTEFLGAVGSQAAMLALTGQRGDWCSRTDLGTDWQLIADAPALLGSWREHIYPASPVSSVAGRTGAVVLGESDIPGLVTDLAAKAADALVVHLAGTETITGAKTFSTAPVVPAPSAAGNPVRHDDVRNTDSRPPSGTASGSLAGAYPGPSLAAGAVGGTEIAAAIKDPAAATAGLRTLGTGAAQAAAGTHTHTSGSVTPADHGLLCWSCDPAVAAGSSALISGTVYLARVPVPADVSVTKIYWGVGNLAVSPVAGQNEVGIYDPSGNKLVAANVDAVVTSSGLKTTTIASTSLVGLAFVWVAFVFNAATPPGLQRTTATISGGFLNAGLTAAASRASTNGTAKTVLPTSITPSAATQAANVIFAALGL